MNWGSGDSVLWFGQSVSFEFPAAGAPSEQFSASRGGGGAPPRTSPREVWEVWKVFRKTSTTRLWTPEGSRNSKKPTWGTPTNFPPIQSKQNRPRQLSPGGGDCAPEAAACKGLGTASLRPHVQTSRSKLQGRGCSGRDDELRFRRPPLSENALV